MKTNRVYSNKYWEVKPFPESVEDGRTWREGMVGGNGENGFITSGAPYSDTIISVSYTHLGKTTVKTSFYH